MRDPDSFSQRSQTRFWKKVLRGQLTRDESQQLVRDMEKIAVGTTRVAHSQNDAMYVALAARREIEQSLGFAPPKHIDSGIAVSRAFTVRPR